MAARSLVKRTNSSKLAAVPEAPEPDAVAQEFLKQYPGALNATASYHIHGARRQLRQTVEMLEALNDATKVLDTAKDRDEAAQLSMAFASLFAKAIEEVRDVEGPLAVAEHLSKGGAR